MTAWIRRAPITHLIAAAAALAGSLVAATAFLSTRGHEVRPPAPISLRQLALNELTASPPPGMSGQINFVNTLVPPTAVGLANDPPPLLTGGHGRVWYAPGHLRVELQTRDGDTQLLVSGSTVRVYDAAEATVYRFQLPDLSGGGLGASGVGGLTTLVGGLAQQAAVGRPQPGVVGGRPAYTVRAAARGGGTLVGAVTLAADAGTGIPLRVEVYARGERTPGLDLAVSDVRYGPVDPRVFDVRIPPQVTRLELGGAQPAGSGRVSVLGTGLGSVLVFEQPTQGSLGGDLWSLFPTVDVNGVPGRELVTPLGTVIRFDRGGTAYTVAGSAPPAVVEQAARIL